MSVSATSVWGKIWVHPKKTMEAILQENPKKWIIWLAIIWGILSLWLGLSTSSHEQVHALSTGVEIALILIVGAVAGIVHLYVGGWLLQLTGSWVGGEGNFVDVKSAVGWNFYPNSVAILFGLLGVAAFPNPWLQLAAGIVYIVGAIWAFVIFMNLLAAAHKVSAWKALLAFIIAVVLVLVALMVITLLAPLLAPLFR
ncbi:MAG: hypothetical protein K940chlam9_00923 [Chlamydiae bacterium]|nr:hypothetical protein [Chlamydiota bacterium]